MSAQRRIPKLRKHKSTNRAIVRFDGKDYYLGKWGGESTVKYERAIAEWLSTGRNPMEPTEGMSIVELIHPYLKFAKTYYRKNGRVTGEMNCIKAALRPLTKLYAKLPASEFGPKALKAVRQTMVDHGYCRTTVNEHVGRIRRMFRWATENELIPPSIYHGLQAVAGLRKGRTPAPEPKGVSPVAESLVKATLPYVSAQVAAMIQIQNWTGMRPGEVVLVRSCDLERGENLWIDRPSSHKTEHLDRDRQIAIGPKAQEIIRPFLKADPQAFLFDPRDAEELRHREQQKNRKSPVQPSQRNRRKKKPRLAPRNHYDTASYRRAIARACKKAGLELWSPNQLRHTAATRLRKEFGIEAARVVLGHASAMTTEIYAEIDKAKARQIMEGAG